MYSYDRYGKIRSGAEIGNIRTEYEFDNFNNISREYEIIGGRIEKKSYYYDNANRLLLEDSDSRTVQYEYDNSGNLIKKITGIDSNAETSHYRYDGYNRLSEFIDDYSTAEYEYNINGLRESKTVNGTKTRYIYNGADIVGEIFDDNIYTYYRATELIGYTNNKGDRYYYRQNSHGDVTALLTVDGQEKKTYSYNAYGKENPLTLSPMGSQTVVQLWKAETEQVYNPFRYCGEYQDSETGFIYLRARMYDPETGRFITEDPIRDGLNWYVYCGNDPVNHIDPNGLSGIKTDGTYYITHPLDEQLLKLKQEYVSATPERQEQITIEAQNIRNSGKKGVDWSVRADRALDYYMIDTDITQKLNNVISSSESENWWKRFGTITPITNAARYLDFAIMVMPGGKYDLKESAEWKGKEHFIYSGEIIRYDEPGNILYGHLGKVMGFDDAILKKAGGAVQIIQGRSNWEYISSYFDDPRDQKAIQKGIDIFKNTHSRIWW